MDGAEPDHGDISTLAVVVSAGVSAYLPHTLHAIAEQHQAPTTVLIVDVSRPGGDLGTGRPLQQVIDEAGLPEATRVLVHSAPRAATFGAAVRHGLAHQEELAALEASTSHDYLWLLHDDSAPAPEALMELGHAAEAAESIALIGAKQRGWQTPAEIIEVGIQATASARRLLDVEPGEIDQGQYDHRDDVLATGLAGALVRRKVWQQLGGTDPALGPFGDGLNFSRRAWLAGYRVVVAPLAVVHHARASYLGMRHHESHAGLPDVQPDARRSFTARRRAQLYNWITSTPAAMVPLVGLAMLVAAPLRAAWRLVTKEVGLVAAEMYAAADVVARPRAVWRGRRLIAAHQHVPRRHLRPLLARPVELRRGRRNARRAAAAARSRRAAPSELEIAEAATLARRRRATGGILTLVLLAIALVAFGLLLRAGALSGGALWPLDLDLGELWHRAVGSWLPAGLGHPGPSDPLLSVLGVLMLPVAALGGSANVVLTGLLVLAIPLAGIGAWFASGAATRSVLLRAWATVMWALAPTLLLASGQGRIGTLLAHLALPWVALGVTRALGVARRDVIVSGLADANRDQTPPQATVDDSPSATAATPSAAAADPVWETPRSPSAMTPRAISAAAGAGLAAAVAMAGAPVLLAPLLLTLVVLAFLTPRVRRVLILLALPSLVLLGPLLTAAMRDWAGGSWRALLADPGVALGSDPAAGWLALLGWPTSVPPGLGDLVTGHDDTWPIVLGTGGGAVLLLLAVLAFLRGTGRARAVRVGWLLAIFGLGVHLVTTSAATGIGSELEASSGEVIVTGWGGAGTSLLNLGLLVAAVSAGDGMRARVAASSFGWRQAATAVLALLMVVGPLATTSAWLLAKDDEPRLAALQGRTAPPVPALATELQTSATAARVLALQPGPEAIDAEVWRGYGPQLSEAAATTISTQLTGAWHAEPEEPDEAGAGLDDLVAELAAGTTDKAGEQLGELAVGVVLVPPAAGEATERPRQELIAQLDATAGLDRVTENESGAIWRTSQAGEEDAAADSVARARILDADGTWLDDVASDGTTAGTRVPSGEEGRVVVLAERSDAGWKASYEGRSLRATSHGWRQAFELPAHAGELDITYSPAWQLPWRIAQVAVLGITVLLAIPVRRRREVIS